jgi:hypothetical protein
MFLVDKSIPPPSLLQIQKNNEEAAASTTVLQISTNFFKAPRQKKMQMFIKNSLYSSKSLSLGLLFILINSYINNHPVTSKL